MIKSVGHFKKLHHLIQQSPDFERKLSCVPYSQNCLICTSHFPPLTNTLKSYLYRASKQATMINANPESRIIILNLTTALDIFIGSHTKNTHKSPSILINSSYYYRLVQSKISKHIPSMFKNITKETEEETSN